MMGMNLKFWKKKKEESVVPHDVPTTAHDLGCICALLYIFGKEHPVKATFVGKCELDPILSTFGVAKHHVVTAHEQLERALSRKFIRADFDYYYPTASIEKVELQCSEHMVQVPDEPVEEPVVEGDPLVDPLA